MDIKRDLIWQLFYKPQQVLKYKNNFHFRYFVNYTEYICIRKRHFDKLT